MFSTAHPGRLLKRELAARGLSVNRLAQGLGGPLVRITDILNGRRAIAADTAVRLGRYFGNRAQFWLDLQGQHGHRRGRTRRQSSRAGGEEVERHEVGVIG